ncbi:MAG: LPS assembly lipoprotein LptE [Phenylobacterium sp.]|jgi:LPS-assembly lipoprotein|nr:LPS assembly lipoprotein LptE [Phenylobacterium sp.]
MSPLAAALRGAGFASLLLLAGCGFTPLYATPDLGAGLAAVEVTTPEGRAGALLREQLDDALGRRASSAPAYRLDVALSELRYPRGVRVDNVATRYEYVLTAAYTFSAAAPGEALKTGKVRVELTYDSADQPYASVIAQQDAQVRAAQEAARRIHLELAAFLAGQGS